VTHRQRAEGVAVLWLALEQKAAAGAGGRGCSAALAVAVGSQPAHRCYTFPEPHINKSKYRWLLVWASSVDGAPRAAGQNLCTGLLRRSSAFCLSGKVCQRSVRLLQAGGGCHLHEGLVVSCRLGLRGHRKMGPDLARAVT
jgi:hypothetical protein